MKKVLMITNVFPPYKGVGRHRIIQFAKYLPQYGWEPIILAPTYSYLWEKDMNTLNEIPKLLKVYHAFMPIPLPVLVKRLSHIFYIKKSVTANDKIITNNPLINSNEEFFIKKIVINIINTIHNLSVKYLCIPDQHIIWFPYVLFKALRIIKNEKIDIILSCSPVNSMHIFGFILKVLTRKPWVTDYRDLWTGDHFHPWKGTTRIFLEKQIEKLLLRKSCKIIVNSPQTATAMKKNFPSLNHDLFVVISNGFDIASYPLRQNMYKKCSTFRIVHTGQLLSYSKSSFLKALGIIVNKYPETRKKIQIDLIGNISTDLRYIMSEEIKKYNLTQNINFIGWVSYQESIKYQREADVLLLILNSDIPNAGVVVHAKLFEYIFANRPILALLPDGAAKDIIIRTNTGIVVSPDNINQISSRILKMFHSWEKNNFKVNPNWNKINSYNRKNLTRKLAHLFNSFN